MDSSRPFAKELEIACLTVQRASLVTKKLLLESVDKLSIDKSDATPVQCTPDFTPYILELTIWGPKVTIADFAAQAMIIAAIHGIFPNDEFAGEEDSKALRKNPDLLQRTWELVSTTHLDDDKCEARLCTPRSKEEMLDIIDLGSKGKCDGTRRTWTLDPVDGTATFMRGQQYAVCLALLEHGQEQVGVLGCPNLNLEKSHGVVTEDIVEDANGLGCMLFAVRGQNAPSIRKMGRGALLPSHRLAGVAQVTDPHDIRFVDCSAMANSSNFQLHRKIAAELGVSHDGHMLTNVWSAQMRYVALAAGGCNALLKIPRNPLYRSNIWDHAGGMLIARESGFKVTDLEGNPVNCATGRKLTGCYGMVVAPPSIHAVLLVAAHNLLAETL